MRERKIDRTLLGISIGGFLLMSLSFLLMPIDALGITPGLLFWLGLVAGVIMQILLENRRRKFFRSYKINRKTMQKPRNGLLSFNSNKIAAVADLSMIASLAITILVFVLSKGYGYICYVFVAMTVFSFCMHCIFNGRIYFHAKNQLKVRQVLEQKKANTSKGEGENA